MPRVVSHSIAVAILCICVFGVGVTTLHAEVWSEGGLGSNGATGVVRQFDPGSGNLVPIEVGTPDSIYGYFYRSVCFDESSGDIDCLAGQNAACDAAPNGQYVWWYSGLKTQPRESWAKYGDGPTCIYSEEPQDVGEQISAVILSEFQSRPIAAGSLGMQPSPHTLIGAQTNFYVDAREQTFDFVLLGQDIRITATPTEYEWTYGDGSTYGPAPFAGGPLPESRWGEQTATSHVYGATGDFQASVVVHFSGEYSINGGPLVPIDGRAAVPSAPQTVSVWRSTSNNVADDCLVNPAGYGC